MKQKIKDVFAFLGFLFFLLCIGITLKTVALPYDVTTFERTVSGIVIILALGLVGWVHYFHTQQKEHEKRYFTIDFSRDNDRIFSKFTRKHNMDQWQTQVFVEETVKQEMLRQFDEKAPSLGKYDEVSNIVLLHIESEKHRKILAFLCVLLALLCCFLAFRLFFSGEASKVTRFGEIAASYTGESVVSHTVPKSWGKYVSSVNSDKFHYPTCRHAQSIAEQNIVYYATAKDALADGKEPCSVCQPK